MSKALAVQQSLDVMTLADVLVKSGFFKDTRQQAQAVVKVLAGQELGFGPIASMTSIHIVQGRPVLSANLMAALVKRHPRYNYRVTEHTAEVCTLVFLEDGQQIGTSQFTKGDATAAGLMNGANWQKYPRNMLFARALSNGVKWHCPDVLSGSVYTPDEMDADVDEDGAPVIEWLEVDAPAVADVPDWALRLKTPKGTLYTSLTSVQLKEVREKTPDESREYIGAGRIINSREIAYGEWADAIVEAGYAENGFNALAILRHSLLNGNEEREAALTFAAAWRGARDSGATVEDAALAATQALMEEVPYK